MKNKFVKTIVLVSLVFSSIYAKDIIIEKNINMKQKELDEIYKKYVDRTYPTEVKTYEKDKKEELEAKEREEKEAWQEIKNSTNHKKFQSFINEYPKSKHFPEAKKLLKKHQAITHQGYEYKIVKSPYTQKLWLDRNLGASQVCTSYDDNNCYGKYYEFSADGRTICPSGFKIPSKNELERETKNILSRRDAFKNFLKLPLAGYRGSKSGQLIYDDSHGFVWSRSTKGEDDAWFLHLHNGEAFLNAYQRVDRYSVRCLKDDKYEK